MPFKHTCKRCNFYVEYENNQEKDLKLSPFFYIKSGYYRNVCKECERKEHKEKFANGKYNYYNKKDDGYIKEMVIGRIE